MAWTASGVVQNGTQLHGEELASVDVGTAIQEEFVVVLSVLVLYGIYLVMVGLALYTIFTRPRKPMKITLLLVSLVLTFLIATTYCTMPVVFLGSEIQSWLISKDFGQPDWLPAAGVLSSITGTIGDTGLVFLINDVLATGRAMAVWQSGSKALLRAILWFLTFSTFALSFPMYIYENKYPSTFTSSTTYIVLVIVGSCASIVVNALATWMIGYTAYTHRMLSWRSGLQSQGARVLVLLTGGGILYGVIQVARLVLYLSALPSRAPSYSHTLAHGAFTASTTVISAMYAPALVLIVHHGYNTPEPTSSQHFTVGFGLSGPDLSKADPEIATSSKPLPPLVKDPHDAPNSGHGSVGPNRTLGTYSGWRLDGPVKQPNAIAKHPGKMQIAIVREIHQEVHSA